MRAALCLAAASAVTVAIGYTVPSAAAIGQTVPSDPERASQMRQHFTDAMMLHAAIIRGDVPAVAEAGEKLTQYEAPPSSPPGSAEHVTAIRAAASLTVGAKNIVTAAYATALILGRCGDCHRAVGTMPSVRFRTTPEIGGIVGHMLDHQRAADQLLQGLVIPSNALWEAGARDLIAAPLEARDLPSDSNERRRMAATEERLHRLARQAVHATNAGLRTSVYGQILGACAECHQQHAKVWGPAPPPPLR